MFCKSIVYLVFCLFCFGLVFVFFVCFCFVFFAHFTHTWLKNTCFTGHFYLLFCFVSLCASLLLFVIFCLLFVESEEECNLLPISVWRRNMFNLCLSFEPFKNIRKIENVPVKMEKTHWRCLFSSCPVSPIWRRLINKVTSPTFGVIFWLVQHVR